MRISLISALLAATAFVPGVALAQDVDRGTDGRSNRQARMEARADAQAEQPRQQQPRFEQPRSEQPRAEQPRQEQPRAEQPRPDQPRFDRGNNGGNNGGGGWNRGNRPDRGQNEVQQPRPQQQVDQPRPQPQAQFNPDQNRGGRPDFRGGNGQGGGQWRGDRGDRGVTPNVQGVPGYRGDRAGNPDRRNDWRGNDNRGGNVRGNDNRGGDWRNNGNRGNDWRGNAGRNDNRYADRGGNNRGAWNRDWRGDNRYDWSRRRQYDRNAFHLPRYYAPHGWNYGYRRFTIGFTLNAGLFANNYWIEDPYYYGLPEAYGPYRWVRYYNDALLVDVYSGEVVDTVYDIFW